MREKIEFIKLLLYLNMIWTVLSDDNDIFVDEINTEFKSINFSIFADQNLTAIVDKQTRLPCFVEYGRKFIWMQTKRDLIIAIDNNVIASDRRFKLETKCSTLPHNRLRQAEFIFKYSSSKDLNGCWNNLVIENVHLDDESLYICQIDTMLSTRVNLNVLGTRKCII